MVRLRPAEGKRRLFSRFFRKHAASSSRLQFFCFWLYPTFVRSLMFYHISLSESPFCDFCPPCSVSISSSRYFFLLHFDHLFGSFFIPVGFCGTVVKVDSCWFPDGVTCRLNRSACVCVCFVSVWGLKTEPRVSVVIRAVQHDFGYGKAESRAPMEFVIRVGKNIIVIKYEEELRRRRQKSNRYLIFMKKNRNELRTILREIRKDNKINNATILLRFSAALPQLVPTIILTTEWDRLL